MAEMWAPAMLQVTVKSRKHLVGESSKRDTPSICGGLFIKSHPANYPTGNFYPSSIDAAAL